MGFMDFLKKKSDSGLGSEASSFDLGKMEADSMTPATPGMDFGQNPNMSNPTDYSSMNSSSFGQSSMQPQGQDMSRDIQMISLKLDSIKSELDAINQRLKSLEQIAEREQSKTTKKWY
jgi:hypothetical protein